jgi:hypothetical protein
MEKNISPPFDCAQGKLRSLRAQRRTKNDSFLPPFDCSFAIPFASLRVFELRTMAQGKLRSLRTLRN